MAVETSAREAPLPVAGGDAVVLCCRARASRQWAGRPATVMNIHEAASRLAAATELGDVAPADVRDLAERGVVRAVVPGRLYDLDGVRPVAIKGELRQIAEARRAWLTASLDRWDAAAALSVSVQEFDALAARSGLRRGRFGRYERTEIMGLRR